MQFLKYFETLNILLIFQLTLLIVWKLLNSFIMGLLLTLKVITSYVWVAIFYILKMLDTLFSIFYSKMVTFFSVYIKFLKDSWYSTNLHIQLIFQFSLPN